MDQGTTLAGTGMARQRLTSPLFTRNPNDDKPAASTVDLPSTLLSGGTRRRKNVGGPTHADGRNPPAR
jgi:hypothetical protein